MTASQMSTIVAEFLMEANKLQWKKNADYHPDDVAFLEILRTACETGISVEQDLWAKIRKQYIALRGFMIDGKYESEPPVSRMIDIAVYMGMSAFWFDNQKKIVQDAFDFISLTRCEKDPTSGITCIECDRCIFFSWLGKRVIDNARQNR